MVQWHRVHLVLTKIYIFLLIAKTTAVLNIRKTGPAFVTWISEICSSDLQPCYAYKPIEIHSGTKQAWKISISQQQYIHPRIIVYDYPHSQRLLLWQSSNCLGASKGTLGAVSIRKTVLPGMAIPMLKIRRPNGRLIFNMEITIRR